METDIALLNACLPAETDERDYMLAGSISTEIRRSAVCPPPFDLPDINQLAKTESKYSCVACAISGIRHQLSRMQNVVEQYDYVELYQRCKEIDGLPGINGTTLKAALTIAKNRGVKTIYGKYRKIKEYKLVNVADLNEIETALYLYHEILAAYTLSNAGWRGETVRAPKSGEPTGGHAIMLNGYGLENFYAQDSMPSYHNGKCEFDIPKTYLPNAGYVITVDDVIVDTSLSGYVASDVGAIVDGEVVPGLICG